MGVRENSVEGYLDEEVAKLGGFTRKFVSPGHVGVPDRIVVCHGIVFFVEGKTHDGVLSAPQERELKKFIAHGANTSVVYGHGAVDIFIEGLRDMIIQKKGKRS